MFSPIPDILADVRAGKFIVLVDDESRENEGDLVLAAQHVTPERINSITRLANGYLCLSLTVADCERLALHPQAPANTSVRGTAFTVSIDGHPKHGVGTGVSAFDRAKTVELAIDPRTTPDDFVRPGHINPLRSRDGGVLVRVGQTEGAVDLARLAGLHPSALIIEIVREDGRMARRDDLDKFCKLHGFKMCSIAQLIEHRLSRERLVKRMPPDRGTTIRTDVGEFNLIAFESAVDPLPHIALTLGGVGDLGRDGNPIETDKPTLVRMHRRSVLGDIFNDLSTSPEGSTGRTLRAAMRAIQREKRGAIVYLRPEGVGDELEQRLTALRRHDIPDDAPDLISPTGVGASVVPMHQRDFGVGGQILRELGLRKLRLLTNHPKELPGLDAFGLEIAEQVPLDLAAS
ncbi:MAG TPA: 3,4-dihydroxy-2-butanone-4-phosphate synthase [Phycisphaerales bacterium]|nr:3,4-dihydroxy-2-butanone-4-phosphate synthase [Phycisphaerales bacterium]